MTTVNPHASDLPLWWLRLPALLTTIGLTAVCIAVGAQAIRGTLHLEDFIRGEALAQNVDIKLNMQDVREVTIVLTVVAVLLGSAALICTILLSFDLAAVILKSGKKSQRSERKQPISTRYLHLQSLILSFLTVWLLCVLIPTTIIVRRRSAKVIFGNQSNMDFIVDTKYWDYGFLRCLGAAPWFSLLPAAPASLITVWANYITRQRPSYTSGSGNK